MLGREHESALLMDATATGQSELIAVIGRRRVGKTFMIKTVYEKQLRFYQMQQFC